MLYEVITPALRPGGRDRPAHPPAFDLARSAPPADRVQPRGAPDRGHGARRARLGDAVERQPRSARSYNFV